MPNNIAGIDHERGQAEDALQFAMAIYLDKSIPLDQRVARAHALAAIGGGWATLAVDRRLREIIPVAESPTAHPAGCLN